MISKIEKILSHLKDFHPLYQKDPKIFLLSASVLAFFVELIILGFTIFRCNFNEPMWWTAFFVIVLLTFFTLIVAIILFFKSPKPPHRPYTGEGRYFIGIDMGRFKIEYSLIDYEEFKKHSHGTAFKIYSGNKPTLTNNFYDNYALLIEILTEISKEAKSNDIDHIDGIGVGLPGQVDPGSGMLIKSPGFINAANNGFVEILHANIMRNFNNNHFFLNGNIPIKIDNDVRCATRYLWKKEAKDFHDGICILVGNGLGSGIVLGGRLLYGNNFMAGEIGHTIICCSVCCEGGNLLKGHKCSCGAQGYHWEMYASSHGMTRIAKKLNEDKYNQLREKCLNSDLSKDHSYKALLNQDPYKAHFRDNRHIYGNDVNVADNDVDNELTSYFFSLAYHAKDQYILKVVDKFLDYLAVGIANYINVINPKTVYLGGGMISGFFNGTDLIDQTIRDKVTNFVLDPAKHVNIRILENDSNASIGAALIFRDDSYPGNTAV